MKKYLILLNNPENNTAIIWLYRDYVCRVVQEVFVENYMRKIILVRQLLRNYPSRPTINTDHNWRSDAITASITKFTSV